MQRLSYTPGLLPGGLALALWVALAIHPQDGDAVQQGHFTAPSLIGFSLVDEYLADGDGDGRKETRIRRYSSTLGYSLFNMTTNGTTWAWSVDATGDADADISKNYVLRDSNCDGVFDERYGLGEEFHVPPCVKEAAQGP